MPALAFLPILAVIERIPRVCDTKTHGLSFMQSSHSQTGLSQPIDILQWLLQKMAGSSSKSASQQTCRVHVQSTWTL